MSNNIHRITSAQNPLIKQLIRQRENLPLFVKRHQWADVNILIHCAKMVDECLRLHRIKPNCLLVSNEQMLYSDPTLTHMLHQQKQQHRQEKAKWNDTEHQEEHREHNRKSCSERTLLVVTSESIIRRVCNVQSTNGICATFAYYPRVPRQQDHQSTNSDNSDNNDCYALSPSPSQLYYSDTIDERLAFQKLSTCRRTVVINKLEDAGNLGTIMRSAYGFGFDSIVVIDGSISPFNEKVIKSSRTTIFCLPIIHCSKQTFVRWMNEAPDIACVISTCETGQHIDRHAVHRFHPSPPNVANDTAEHHVRSLQHTPRLCVMLNHEHAGDEHEFSKLLPNISYIHIPMAHSYDSINVSQVAAILLHHFQ